jgi:hypothetical protein
MSARLTGRQPARAFKFLAQWTINREEAVGMMGGGCPETARGVHPMSLEDQLPESPPPEVTQAIEVASEAYEVLSATGQQVHFGLDPWARALEVELRDLHGNPLSTLSASDALQLAAGGEDLT